MFRLLLVLLNLLTTDRPRATGGNRLITARRPRSRGAAAIGGVHYWATQRPRLYPRGPHWAAWPGLAQPAP